jgi:hypothetical protein
VNSSPAKKTFSLLDWADLYYWLALATFVLLAALTTIAYFGFHAFVVFNSDGQLSSSFIIWGLLGVPAMSLCFPLVFIGALFVFAYIRAKIRRSSRSALDGGTS